MPGSRLGQEERDRIAAWLADGLGYAEIGRLLGRPTSTISREVARNGGFGGYSAADAQQAAASRARRAKPERRARSQRPDGWPDESVRDLAEELATVLTATGLSRMSARVFTCLLTADADADADAAAVNAGLTAADLVRRLRVSPASVSKSIANLAAMDLVVRRPDPGTRRERYAVDDGVWLRAWRTDSGTHAAVAAAAGRGARLFGADTPAGTRLGHMERFFSRLSEQMRGSSVAVGDSGADSGSDADDALTFLAALIHTGRALPLGTLAAALGWPEERARIALTMIRAHPAIAQRLSPPQIEALYEAVTAASVL